MSATKGHVWKCLWVMLLSFGLLVGSCEAEPLSVQEILGNAGKYSDRQVQVVGRVERWVELGNSEKTAWYVLKDNFGDIMPIRTTETMPPVGENVTVKGLVIFDGKKNEYYIQSLNTITGSKPGAGSNTTSSGPSSMYASMLAYGPNSSRYLLALATVAGMVFLFITVIAFRVRKHKKNVCAVPDFSFDETETIRIDVNGQFVGSGKNDESTLLLMPGHFKITKGPKEMEGRLYRLTSVLTKVGREESTIDKSSGWITFPSNCTMVSRHQADLVFKDGAYHVENRSRANVTRVNGVNLNCGEPYRLSDKDIIAFSEIEMTYSISSAEFVDRFY